MIALFTAAQATWGQMVVQPITSIIKDDPVFSSLFVAAHCLKSMKGHYATKFDRDIIRPNDDVYSCAFNQSGQLVKQYKVFLGDTLTNSYHYDYQGNIVLHRQSNAFGFCEHTYTYDDRQRLVKAELREVQTAADSLGGDRDSLLSTETYAYVPLREGGYKQLCYNSEGRVYQVVFHRTDERGQLVSKMIHDGFFSSETHYSYTASGRLAAIESRRGADDYTHRRQQFEYDAGGSVLSKKMYRNGVLTYEEQFVYDSSSGLLKAIISREEAEGKITILEFDDYQLFRSPHTLPSCAPSRTILPSDATDLPTSP